MPIESVHEFVVENGTIGWIGPRLLPNADTIRIYGHFPRTEMSWRKMSVPFTPNGQNMTLTVQALNYDVEMDRGTFLGTLGDLDRSSGGLYPLIQSDGSLPGNMHPSSFVKSETFLKVLRDCGACLMYELPHQNEFAGLTIFGDDNLAYLIGEKLIEPDSANRMRNVEP